MTPASTCRVTNGKKKRDWQSPDGKAKLLKVGKLAAVAAKTGMPIHHMALLWCLSNKNVSTVILGASKQSQLVDNLSALENRDKLTDEVKSQIEEILQNKPAGPLRY